MLTLFLTTHFSFFLFHISPSNLHDYYSACCTIAINLPVSVFPVSKVRLNSFLAKYLKKTRTLTFMLEYLNGNKDVYRFNREP